MNKLYNIKRFLDDSGDVEIVKQEVFDYIDSHKLTFTRAEIEQEGLSSICNPKSKAFYPLRIFTSDGTVMMISEVRTGYQGASTRALIDILKYAGFTVKRELIDSIFNERKIRRVINF